MKMLRIIVFILASLLVLFVVSFKIIRAEITLARGESFRFPIAGYDPHDIFRGRYLAIRMEIYPKKNPERNLSRKVYGNIIVDEKNLAHIEQLSPEAPESGAYLTLNYPLYGNRFDPPFERYYMNEKLAPEAERVLAEAWRKEGSDTVLLLKVYKGFAVIEDLQIDGRPIRELAREAGRR